MTAAIPEGLRAAADRGGIPWDLGIEATVIPERLGADGRRIPESRHYPPVQVCELGTALAGSLIDSKDHASRIYGLRVRALAVYEPKSPQLEPAEVLIARPLLAYASGIDVVLTVNARVWDRAQRADRRHVLVYAIDYGLSQLETTDEGRPRRRARPVVDPAGMVARWGKHGAPDTAFVAREAEQLTLEAPAPWDESEAPL